MLLHKATASLKSRVLQDLRTEQILVRLTPKEKDAIYRASEAVGEIGESSRIHMTPPNLMRTIVTKVLENAGYLERPEAWELSDLLKAIEKEKG